ncbi:hypothetical protein EYZ11_011365 [Aspergillus tanneri]|uniref:Cytochrome P450 n=1 Tax=Aspergillus tanneri TaxID=1220188 RepID=A0A4V3UMZ2_9EURO|nr:hypothetical protein EYZ11_011365 [Aspergillus tanneri]
MPLHEWINQVPNSGLIRYRKRFNKEIVFVTSPKGLSEVLIQKNYEFSKPYKLRQGLGRILGVGLLIAEGEDHKIQRKHLMPAFSHRHIMDLYPIFWDRSVALAQELQANIDGRSNVSSKVVDVADWLARATLDIIGAAGFGEEFDTIRHPDNEIRKAYRSVLEQKPPKGTLKILIFLAREQLIRTLALQRNDSIAVATRTLTRVARRLIAAKRQNPTAGDARDVISVALSSGSFNAPCSRTTS